MSEENLSLENFDFKDLNRRLNSPLSKEACRRIGVNENDLYFIDYETFLKINKDIHSLPREFQELRFNFAEKVRKENLRLCIQERRNIIKEFSKKGNNSSLYKNTVDYLPSNNDSNFENRKNFSINSLIEKKRLEIRHKVDLELKLEKIKKSSENDLEMEKERDDAIRQIQIKHQREKLDLSQKKETIKKKAIRRE